MIHWRKDLVLLTITGLAVLAVVLLIQRFWPSRPDPRVQQEQQAAASAKVAVEADNTRLLGVVDSINRALQDTAAYHRKREQRALDRADAKEARIQYLLAHAPSASYAMTPGDSGPPLPDVVDSASTCEERYTLRTGQASDLREALGECKMKASADSLRAQFVFDSMSTANGRLTIGLNRSDSARRAEIVRPRPCRRNLVVAHPSCGAMDVVTLGLGFVLGVVIVR